MTNPNPNPNPNSVNFAVSFSDETAKQIASVFEKVVKNDQLQSLLNEAMSRSIAATSSSKLKGSALKSAAWKSNSTPAPTPANTPAAWKSNPTPAPTPADAL